MSTTKEKTEKGYIVKRADGAEFLVKRVVFPGARKWVIENSRMQTATAKTLEGAILDIENQWSPATR